VTPHSTTLSDILARTRVIPVVVLDDVAHAVPLARALLRGGLGVIEITLRTPAALECVRRIAAEVPEAVVGAGTVLTPADLSLARAAGAAFAVSPGTTPSLISAAKEAGLPFLPGAATVSEMLSLSEQGFQTVKFFPAEALGGAPYLRALSSPLARMRFVPTGGITPENAQDYLSLPNVSCVGGSWMVLPSVVRAAQWEKVSEAARQHVNPLATLAAIVARAAYRSWNRRRHGQAGKMSAQVAYRQLDDCLE